MTPVTTVPLKRFARRDQRVAQAETLVQLGRIAARGQAERGFAPAIPRAPVPADRRDQSCGCTKLSQDATVVFGEASRPGSVPTGGDRGRRAGAGPAARCPRRRARCARRRCGVRPPAARRAPSGRRRRWSRSRTAPVPGWSARCAHQPTTAATSADGDAGSVAQCELEERGERCRDRQPPVCAARRRQADAELGQRRQRARAGAGRALRVPSLPAPARVSSGAGIVTATGSMAAEHRCIVRTVATGRLRAAARKPLAEVEQRHAHASSSASCQPARSAAWPARATRAERPVVRWR